MPPPSPLAPPYFSLPFGFDFGQTGKNFASAFIYANRNILKIYGSFTAICSIKSIRFLTSAPPPLSSSISPSLSAAACRKNQCRAGREKKTVAKQLAPDSVTGCLPGCGFDYVSPLLPPLFPLSLSVVCTVGLPARLPLLIFFKFICPLHRFLSLLASILGFVCSLLIFIELALVTA